MQSKYIAKLFAFTVLLAAPMFGQSRKTYLYVDCTCDDTVGRRFNTSFRDLLSVSPRFAETPYAKSRVRDDKPPVPNIVVSILSLEDDKDNSAAISVVISLGGQYFGHDVQICGLNKVDRCAADLLSYIDHQITK